EPLMAFPELWRWFSNRWQEQPHRRVWPWGRRQWRPSLERLEERVVPSTVPEIEPNNALLQATALAPTTDPSTFLSGQGLGDVSPANDVDYWRFNAQAGDRLTVAGDGGGGNNSLRIELRDGNDAVLASATDTAGGHAQITNFVVTA